MSAMLTCVAWVPRGAARAEPIRQELSQEEMDMLIAKQGEMKLDDDDMSPLDDADDSDNDSDPSDKDISEDEDEDDDDEPKPKKKEEEAAPKKESVDEFMKNMNLDDYDDEEDGMIFVGRNLAVFNSNKEDPYITLPDEEDEDDETEDLEIKPTDAVCLVGRTEEDQSTLDVYVYDQTTSSLYIHHTIDLPAFPLAFAWMDCDPRGDSGENKGKGNFVAVGGMKEEIEIWNLDVLNVMEPTAILGGRNEVDKSQPVPDIQVPKGKKNKKKMANDAGLKDKLMGTLKEGSHSDSVMSLSWNKLKRQELASGGADNLIKLWDVTTQRNTATFTHHKNKVQSLEWNPKECNILLSASYDRTAAVLDVRSPNTVMTVKLDSDAECVRWSPHFPFMFLAATERGTVTAHDMRQMKAPQYKPIFTLGAHDKPVSSITFNHKVPTCFATSSIDKTVKVWDFSDNKLSMVCSRDMQIGEIFTSAFDVDSPFLLAAVGKSDKLAIWDILENADVSKRYDPQSATAAASSSESKEGEKVGKNKKKKEKKKQAAKAKKSL